MTEMFGEAWSPMSVPDLAPDDDDRNITERTLLGIVTLFAKLSISKVRNLKLITQMNYGPAIHANFFFLIS